MKQVARYNTGKTPINPYKFLTPCRKTFRIKDRPCFPLYGIDGLWMVREEFLDRTIVIQCPKTHRIYPRWFEPGEDKFALRCPGCQRFIYKKKKKPGRKAMYDGIKKEILDKCKHKWVQQRLKTQIFKMGIYDCREQLKKYQKQLKGLSPVGYEAMDLKSLCKGIRRYIRAINDIEAEIYETNHNILADREMQTTKEYEKSKEKDTENNGDYGQGDFDEYEGG